MGWNLQLSKYKAAFTHTLGFSVTSSPYQQLCGLTFHFQARGLKFFAITATCQKPRKCPEPGRKPKQWIQVKVTRDEIMSRKAFKMHCQTCLQDVKNTD